VSNNIREWWVKKSGISSKNGLEMDQYCPMKFLKNAQGLGLTFSQGIYSFYEYQMLR